MSYQLVTRYFNKDLYACAYVFYSLANIDVENSFNIDPQFEASYVKTINYMTCKITQCFGTGSLYLVYILMLLTTVE